MLDLSKYLIKIEKKIEFYSSHPAMLFVTCQISNALSYLESRQLIHRDVSTRNCLVFNDYMIKLTDIAMASPVYSNYYSTDTHLPVRWMSPDILMVCLKFFFRLFLFFSFGNRMVEMAIQSNLMFIVLVLLYMK